MESVSEKNGKCWQKYTFEGYKHMQNSRLGCYMLIDIRKADKNLNRESLQ